MNDVLYHLCRHCVGIMDGWVPYPAWRIAKQCGFSVSTARRRLRKLKEDGYVQSVSELCVSDDELALPYHGWTITDKAKGTPEYQKAWAEEVEICREVFGKEMFPYEEVLQDADN